MKKEGKAASSELGTTFRFGEIELTGSIVLMGISLTSHAL
jgi:hypothetical protein